MAFLLAAEVAFRGCQRRGYRPVMSTSRIYQEQLVGVFGQPVAENPTVVMHQAAFAALGLPWRYLTIEVAP